MQHIPDGLEARAGLWRDHLAGRRLLLVLDNAASSGQVAPLLPGDGECRVLVTSRRHLSDLPGAVTPVPLDVLTPAQAAAMFARLAPRAGGSTAKVAEMVELAGFLPLAISLLARLFTRHQSWTLADLAAETRSSLLTLTAEYESVAAAFEVSYRHLHSAQQRMFCLLGLHPGTTTEAYAAAALAGSSLNQAAGLLDSLHGEGLLTEISHRRYGMHDLLRRYARDHAASLPDSEQAVERLLGYYQHTAARADALLTRHTHPLPPPAVLAGPLAASPDLRDQDQALAWARAERATLLACLDDAARTGQHARVIALTVGIAGLLRRDGPWADAITHHRAATRAASHLGDRLGQANALTHLGFVQWRKGDFPGAAQTLEQALNIYRGLENRLGEANALVYLGTTLQSTGDFPGGAQALEQALEIYRGLGDRLGQANALAYFGRRWMTGDCPGGAQALEQALEIYRDLGDRLGEGTALLFLGVARRRTGDYPAAAKALEQALHIFRDIGLRSGDSSTLIEKGTLDTMRGEFARAEECHLQALELARAMFCPWDEARALAGLGRCAMARGHAVQAEFLLRQALEIFQQIGAAEAPDVLAELDALTSQALQGKP